MMSFDFDFSGPSEWARAYRALNLNVVPAVIATEKKKHPIAGWREYQHALVPEFLFERWYKPGGEQIRNYSMGFITGPGSLKEGEALLLIDIDVKNGALGPQTWQAWLDEHENGIEPETWRARTGSGGRHLYFRYPAHLKIYNTQEAFNGIDVRAEGGFVMAAPSPHYMPGTVYKWEDIGPLEENDTLADAPDWLIAICMHIGERDKDDNGTDIPRKPRAEVVAAVEEINAFGKRTNGREAYMTRVVWGAVLDLKRSAPMKPGQNESMQAMLRAYEVYVAHVKTRLPTTNEEGLEREGRGLSEFQSKWDRAMEQWDAKVSQEAAKERPERPFDAGPEEPPPSDTPKNGERFPFETVADLRLLPPMKWLVKGWVPETAVGIFYGQWGTGKSFIGFDLLLHLAYGLGEWHDAVLPAEAVDVLMIAREGHQGFVGRIDAFKKHKGFSDDPERLRFMRAAVSFMREDEFKGLCDAIVATGIKFRLIVVDTVARVLAGVDTNEQQAVTLFMERCAILGRLTGAAVIGVHHQNKSGSMMGSVYFEANSDFVFEISRPDDEGPLVNGEIFCTKMKDGQDRWKKTTAYKLIQLNPFNPEDTSLVVESIGDPAAKAAPGGRDLGFIMDEVRRRWEARDPFAVGNQGKRLTLEIWLTQTVGMKRYDAKQAVEKLVGMEAIRPEQFDAKRKLTGWKPAKWSF